ncbi:late embryogenesis abundant protein At1g64065-like [Durio zibethinus]|uniref:Late embryogenesis abundant protein At1g64065-like n=1 Tax=Durio zibethinus TaxID=66656 RepID=A0A6P5YCL0_DURZI|nr:late embryogenesis abundant protein At1g64065-like [Durio zibethinus]
MAEKDQQVHPLAPANKHPRSDEESAGLQAKELKRKKRIKYAVYIAAFAVFQTAIILVFALTVMRVKNPKVRIGRINIETMETNNTGAAAAASFDLKFIAQVTVKNTNFGHYRFDNSTMSFLYDGVIVGEAIIPKARARARSTKKLDVTVEVNSRALTNTTPLGSELSSNILTLNSQAKLKGKVELMKVIKRNKSPEMNCTLTFNVSTRNLQDLNCK